MKKNLLLALSSLIGLSAFAQVRLPGEKDPDPKFTWEKHSAVAPAKMNSVNQGVPFLNRKTKGIVQATTFDPTWANRFQTVLDSAMAATNSKGASVAVYSPEYGTWTGVSGISHPGLPVTADMRFGVGSNTKLFIAVTMVKLQEEGLLTLDDHLYQWLPTFQNIDSTTTIKQLLSHQSGIFDYWNDLPSIFDQIWDDTSRFWTTEEIINSVGPPHFAPGNGYSYSNTNYVLAGMIIEAATGQTWVQKLHDVVFDPLNLDSTFVGAFEPRNGLCSAEWDAWANKVVTNTPMTAEYSQANACGAVLATASEMVQWYKALFNGSIISDSSLQMVLSLDPSSLYGLGIVGGPLNQGVYSHSGGMCGFLSFVLYDVQKQAIICMLFNNRDTDLNSVLGALMNVFYNDYPKADNDAGIARIKTPHDQNCTATLAPVVELTNYGTQPLTTVSIHYQVDQGIPVVFNWSGILNPGETGSVILPNITAVTGHHTFTAYTTLPNGEPDGHTFNDLALKDFIIEPALPVISELFEGFESGVFPPEGWTVNPASIGQWGITPLARLGGNNSLARCNYNDMWTGTHFDFELPLLNISSMFNTDFKFDYAYRKVPGVLGDSLQVTISRDCGETWTTLFNKGSWDLATVPGVTYDMFYPDSPDDWKRASFPLAYFEGSMLIRFHAVNGYGNIIYIDNINLDLLTGIRDDKISSSFTVYPNPFSSATTFTYSLAEPSQVTLSVYDNYGRLVAVPVQAFQKQGEQKVIWDSPYLPAGVYYCRMQVGNDVLSMKMIRIR